MNQDKETLKRLSFPTDPFAYHDTDWDTKRRFVRPTQGLRVWEGGSVELTHSCDKDPNLREYLRDTYGINIVTRKELPMVMTPVTRVKIAKAWLPAGLFMVDERSGRVFALERGSNRYYHTGLGYLVRWTHPASVPYAAHVVLVHRPNKKREKEWYAMNKEFLLKAQAAFALAEAPPRYLYADTVQTILDAPAPKPEQLEYLGAFMKKKAQFKQLILSITQDTFSVPFLRLANFKD